MRAPEIKAIGIAVPDHKIAQNEHYSILESANGMTREEKLMLRKIYSRSGINHRYSVLNEFGSEDREDNLLFHPSGKFPATSVSQRMAIYEQHAATLCKEAVLNCINQLSSLKRNEITHVITFSCTGMYAPGLDIQMVEELGLERSVERTCINFMGCYAAINALKASYHICRSQQDAVVLISGVELCSLHYQRSYDPEQMVANALFGDGAAAAIISSRSMQNSKTGAVLAIRSFYSEFEQSAANDMVWRIGNAGFDLRLTPQVPEVVQGSIASILDKLFLKTGIAPSDIDYYAIHPGGTKILEACEQALQLTKEQNANSYQILSDYGNMSSVTILFVLQKYLDQQSQADKGKKMLVCAFGPGITVESMIVDIS